MVARRVIKKARESINQVAGTRNEGSNLGRGIQDQRPVSSAGT